jgi:hypothetical protein
MQHTSKSDLVLPWQRGMTRASIWYSRTLSKPVLDAGVQGLFGAPRAYGKSMLRIYEGAFVYLALTKYAS